MKSFKQYINEMGVGGMGGGAPANNVVGGDVAGTGQPPGSKSGEPGVHRNRKKKSPVIMPTYSRKM